MEKQAIVLASNNPGKTKEINDLLADSAFKLLPQADFAVVEVAETGLTFVENALLKARNAAQYATLPVIADDSGIEVPVLKGRPGIYSARYAGAGASDEANVEKLINAIKPLTKADRKARFVCVMVYLRHAEDPTPIIAHGIWHGVVVTKPRGENGFGYDPVFYVPTHDCVAAELPPAIKNQLSHRGQALKQLVEQINKM